MVGVGSRVGGTSASDSSCLRAVSSWSSIPEVRGARGHEQASSDTSSSELYVYVARARRRVRAEVTLPERSVK